MGLQPSINVRHVLIGILLVFVMIGVLTRILTEDVMMWVMSIFVVGAMILLLWGFGALFAESFFPELWESKGNVIKKTLIFLVGIVLFVLFAPFILLFCSIMKGCAQ